MRLRGGGLWRYVVVVLLGGALAPSAAAAATVVNGDFETGNLQGWHVHQQTEAGNWFAYRGTEAPLSTSGQRPGAEPVQAPPEGRFAAISDEVSPDSLILWQDVALEPEATHNLGLTAYYQADLPVGTPSPDSLSVDEEVIGKQVNEQFRIDVMKATAPLDSLNPEDILATVFKTETGSPQRMKPTRFNLDLTPFAGQTVRIRAVVVARPDPERVTSGTTKGIFNAGLDAVVINSSGPGVAGSGQKGGKNNTGRLAFGRPRPNRRNGTVLLPVKVPAAGLITASGAKRKPKLVVSAKKRVAGATTAKLLLKPTAAGRRILESKHRLRARITVRFNPEKGATETATVPVVFKLTPPRHHR